MDKLRISIIDVSRGNVSKSRNKGALASYFDHIIFFDADVEIEDSFLETLADIIERKNPDILTSWNKPISKRFVDKILYFINNILFLELIKYFSPGAVGVFIYVRKDSFTKIGGFNESITYAEDYDLARRFHKAGYKYILLKKPRILVSVRRFDKEGRLNFILKLLKGIFYYLFKGLETLQDKVDHEVGKF